ncbi:hypothetical protein [Paraburkholderia sp. RAU2J]|uniref:hypothetical protein n=1 Tax=Paraburkholderia sp. RAU2J TaxID=1938810 RepID=UPI0013157A22|nr:hypothetical protein [Paraburkholderia sp. RAU2J]
MDRQDPVDWLIKSNEGRIPALMTICFARMSASAFAFYRAFVGAIRDGRIEAVANE